MVDVIRHVVIRGQVQGVGFRAFVEDEATRRGIAGWVRNRRDGTVEAVFEGPAEAVAGMIAACRNGPPGARVEAINEREVDRAQFDLSGQPAPFWVLPTV